MSGLKPLTAFQQAYKNNLDKMTIARDYADKERKKMDELKPVAITNQVELDLIAGKCVGMIYPPSCHSDGDTYLYTIPSTHRVVSVELLRRIEADVSPFSHYALKEELRAIIDNKEQK